MTDARPVVLSLTRNLTVGGAERVFLNYVNNASTVSPVVALLERTGGLAGELSNAVPSFARRDGTRARAPSDSDSTSAAESMARLALECLWLRRVVARTGAAVVSSFLMRAHIVALATRLTLLPRMPLVLNIHEHMSDSARFFYPRARDRATMRWIARHLFPRADRIVVVADALKRDLVTSYGIPPAMIDVIHNPLDIGRIRSAGAEPLDAAARPRTRYTIVAVGRLAHLKGNDLVLRAVAKLRHAHDVGVVIVGDGEARASLEQLTAQLGLADVVSFVGEQVNPWRYVARADVLALTSRTEAFPCVLTEAMALGVPVLATESGGVRECLLDNGTPCGVLVPPENIDAIADGLDRLLREPELRATLVGNGLRRVTAFDLPAARDRYESVLAGVIASRSA